MLALAGMKPGELVYDLRAGDRRIMILAARSFRAYNAWARMKGHALLALGE
jgi:hypothetical protein